MMDISTEQLKILTERLEKERPVILRDEENGGYLLFLKGLTVATLDKEQAAIEREELVPRYLQTIRSLLPFFHETGLVSADYELDTFSHKGRTIVGLVVPGNSRSVDLLETLYRDRRTASPFTYVDGHDDEALIELVTRLQTSPKALEGGIA